MHREQEGRDTGDLAVVRLLQNPLGQEAPAGQRGDFVRVSDGRATLYLLPWEFDAADEARLRWLLAQKRSPICSPGGGDVVSGGSDGSVRAFRPKGWLADLGPFARARA